MKLSLSILLVIVGNYIFSQPIVFNKYYDSLEEYEFNKVFDLDTGYISISTRQYSILFIDSLGNINYQKNFADSGFTYGAYVSNVKNADEGSYLKTSGFWNDSITGIQMSKFDSNFDTLWTKKYWIAPYYNPYSYMLHDCIVASNGFIYATGQSTIDLNFQPISDKDDIILLKTNSAGDAVWLKNYSYNNYETGMRILETTDNNIIIGSRLHFHLAMAPDLTQWNILNVTLSGSYNWNQVLGNPDCPDYFQYIIETYDSCLLAVGDYTSNCETILTSRNPYIVKLSLQGDILWEKKMIKPNNDESFMLVLESSDKSLFAISAKISSLGKRIWLYHLTEAGDILWKRPLWLDEPNPFNHYLMFPWDIIETIDGFLICGKTIYNGPQRPFLIKTDYNGCDGLYSCQDTAMQMYLYTWEDSVCQGDSALMSIAISNGNGPFVAIINQNETIPEPLYIMPDTSSYFIYVYPTLSNPLMEVTIIDPYGQELSSNLWFNVINCSNSIDEIVDLTCKIIPNPAVDIVQIEIFNGRYQQSKLEIYNQTGKRVRQMPEVYDKMQIDINGLPSGVYFIKLVSEKGIGVEKFVVLR